MSDCDVCIGGWEGDPAEFYDTQVREARKPHKCCECGREIPAGAQYQQITGKWEGEILTYKTCLICVEIRDVFSCGRGFLFESLWEDLEECGFLKLTTASPCFTKLSAAAKEYTLERWRQWKFGRAA